MKILPIKQDTPEWLELRRLKIGASDASIIMGVSPWATPYELWLQKLGLSEVNSTARMERGKMLEPIAREFFYRTTGHLVVPQVVQHDDHDWMIASLDGMSIDGSVIVEIKCPGSHDHHTAKMLGLPEKYLPQIQHQLYCTGLDVAYYLSFDGMEGVIITVKRDDDYIAKMLEKEHAFYECLMTLEPPCLEERDVQARRDPEWRHIAEQWIKCQNQMKELEQHLRVLKEALLRLAGQQNTKGFGVSVTKVVRKGAIDYSSIPQLQDVDIERYRKPPFEYWKINSH